MAQARQNKQGCTETQVAEQSATATETEATVVAEAGAEVVAEIGMIATMTKTTASVVQKWRPSRPQIKTEKDAATVVALIEKALKNATPPTNPPAPPQRKADAAAKTATTAVRAPKRRHAHARVLNARLLLKAHALTQLKTCPLASMAEVILSLNAVTIHLLTGSRICLVARAQREVCSSASPGVF